MGELLKLYIPISFILLSLFYVASCQSQFYNKEVAAKIKIEQNSEFYSFTATAANLTPSDYSLRYEFLVFKSDDNGNTSKSSQGNRFVIAANQKEILSTTTVNYSEESKIILALIIYDLDDKPIGKDRLVLEEGGKTKVENLTPKNTASSNDQAAPQDGFSLDGLVIENTITKAGRDFYRYFYSEFYNKDIKSPKNIIIEEVPGRFRNTRISVKVDETLVWQFFSQPTKRFLKEMANAAIQRTLAQLKRLEQQGTITRY